MVSYVTTLNQHMCWYYSFSSFNSQLSVVALVKGIVILDSYGSKNDQPLQR